MTTRTILAVLLLQALLCGCSEKRDDLADVSLKQKNDREYVATWSVDGIPTLEVELSYHGKEPKLPFDGPEPTYDWKSRDTDFYSCVIRNLTDEPIRLKDVTSEMESGKQKAAVLHDAEYIKARWGSDVVRPGESLTRRNTWVWGREDHNMLTKTYTAEFAGHNTEPPGAGDRQDGTPQPFSFQVSMEYKR